VSVWDLRVNVYIERKERDPIDQMKSFIEELLGLLLQKFVGCRLVAINQL
jgi:hypothetical protein